MFGQQTLLAHAASQLDIDARVNLIVLRLPAAEFSRLAMQYPSRLAKVSESLEARHRADSSLKRAACDRRLRNPSVAPYERLLDARSRLDIRQSQESFSSN
jgi:CRP-like cAMP-binding protein